MRSTKRCISWLCLTLVLGVHACTWPRDNPDDPWRCDPACQAGQTCLGGACVGADAAEFQDASIDALRADAPRTDGPLVDVAPRDYPSANLPASDVQPVDLSPDAQWPDAKAVCTKSSDCVSSSPCAVGLCSGGKCSYTPAASGTICRKTLGLCDAAEACSGASTACPGDLLVSKGAICRKAASSCDTAETCTGSTKGCPPDVSKKKVTKIFKTKWAYDGTLIYSSGVYSHTLGWVWAGCYKDINGAILTYRGVLAFNSASIPNSVQITTATLGGCHAQTLGKRGNLYKATFAVPITSSLYTIPTGTKVGAIPPVASLKGWQTFPVAPNLIEKTTLTQFTLRGDEAACASIPINTFKLSRWASSQGGVGGTPCSTAKPWELTVTYCQ